MSLPDWMRRRGRWREWLHWDLQQFGAAIALTDWERPLSESDAAFMRKLKAEAEAALDGLLEEMATENEQRTNKGIFNG